MSTNNSCIDLIEYKCDHNNGSGCVCVYVRAIR